MTRTTQRVRLHSIFMKSLHRVSHLCARTINNQLTEFASRFGMCPPLAKPTSEDVDSNHVEFLTTLAARSNASLPEFIRIILGQTTSDPRPNMDLFEFPVSVFAVGNDTINQWNQVMREGVRAEWLPGIPSRQSVRPSNHRDRDQPTRVVEKQGPGGPDIRVINDYSYPDGQSVNDFTDRANFPSISYNPPRDIVRRVQELRDRHPGKSVLMMVGDVAGAFRHVPVHEHNAHKFAFLFENLLVVGLSCGFGRCGSPAFYSLPGGLINRIYERSIATDADNDISGFVGNVWCDGHTCVEIDQGDRCEMANLALRRAIATVLGPHAINEDKFTSWFVQGKSLRLLWNTEAGTASIPTEKIAKARARIDQFLHTKTASKTDLNKLLGCLRHVATCFESARAFYQQIQKCAVSVTTPGQRGIPGSVDEDSRWFKSALRHEASVNTIPVSHFARATEPTVHVYMDASDSGLCALEPTLKQYIRVQFGDHDFLSANNHATNSTNVREFMSAVLAALQWNLLWSSRHGKPTYVCFWIDNLSAVAWLNKRASIINRAQMYNRLLALAEFQYSIVRSARHIPEVENVMADAGSRVWSSSHPLHSIWTNLSSSWSQVPIRPPYDDLSAVWSSCSADRLLRNLPRPSTVPTGASGADSPSTWDGRHG